MVETVEVEKGGGETSRECFNCQSKRIWNRGTRETKKGLVQRFICRDCGVSFSDKSNMYSTQSTDHQLCAIPAGKAKKLDTQTKIKTVCAGIENLPLDVRGLIVQYTAYLEKEGYPAETEYVTRLKTLVRKGANLLDSENVKEVIGRQKMKQGSKLNYCYAYALFAKMKKIDFDMPRYRQEEHIPIIPDEKDLDLLIAATHSKRLATYLQTLKDTLADPGEALKIRWCDISGDIITVNFPVKGHRPRQIQVTPKLVAMLSSFPRKDERVFTIGYHSMFKTYSNLRKKAAAFHHNDKLLKIEFRSFRHWGATKIAHNSSNGVNGVLVAMKVLGHKQIASTMKYIGTMAYEEQSFDVEIAETLEDAVKLSKAGFTYQFDMFGKKIMRRQKRFSS